MIWDEGEIIEEKGGKIELGFLWEWLLSVKYLINSLLKNFEIQKI